MFSLKKLFCFTGLVAMLALVISTTAMAAPSGFSFTAVPQVSFVSPGQNTLINYHGVNNTSASAACVLVVNSDILNNFQAFSGTLAPGQDFGGSISTGVLYKNSKISFNLVCDGVSVASREVNVKVR